MLFRLALRCGYPHPDHLLQTLDSDQLSELYAFMSIEPVDEGIEVIAARWFSLFVNMQNKENDTKPQDWLRDFEHEEMQDDEKARSKAIQSMIRRVADGNRSATSS